MPNEQARTERSQSSVAVALQKFRKFKKSNSSSKSSYASYFDEQIGFLHRIQHECYALILVIIYIACLLSYLEKLIPVEKSYRINFSVDANLLSTTTPELYTTDNTANTSTFSIGGYVYEDILNPEQFFYWLNSVFAPTIWKDYWYNSDLLDDDELYNLAFHNKVIGGLHLYQTRYKGIDTLGEYCVQDYPLNPLSDKCIGGVADNDFECGTRGEEQCSLFTKRGYEAFKYRCDTPDDCSFYVNLELQGRWGKYNDTDYSDPNSQIDYQTFIGNLDDMRWVDDLTKKVGIKFYVWNPNYKLWSQIDISLTFNKAGMVTPYFIMTSMQPDLYNTDLPDVTARINAENGIIVALVLLTLNELLGMYTDGWGYFFSLKNYFDVGLLITGFFFIHLIFDLKEDEGRLEMITKSSYNGYKDWSEQFTAFEKIMNFGTMLLLVNGIYIIRFFAIIPDGRAIVDGISNSLRRMVVFLGMYSVVHLIFAYVGMFLFGSRIKNFHTLKNAAYSMYEIVFCLYDVRSLYDSDNGSVASIVFIMLSAFVLMMILLNVLLAILLGAYEEVKNAPDPLKLSVTCYFKMLFCCCKPDLYESIIEEMEYKAFKKDQKKTELKELEIQRSQEREELFRKRYVEECSDKKRAEARESALSDANGSEANISEQNQDVSDADQCSEMIQIAQGFSEQTNDQGGKTDKKAESLAIMAEMGSLEVEMTRHPKKTDIPEKPSLDKNFFTESFE